MKQKSLKMREEIFGKYMKIIDAAIKKAGAIKSKSKFRDLYDYTYVVYVNNIFEFSNNLANKLYEKFGGFVVLRTVIKNKMFSIYVNLFNIINIWYIDLNHMNAIKPVIKNGFKIMPPEYTLIKVYRDLYDPSQIDKIDNNLKYERELVNQKKPRDRIIVGGNSNIKIKLIDLIADKCVFVGSAAASLMIGEEPDWNAPLEVISDAAESLSKFVYDKIKSDTIIIKRFKEPVFDDLALIRYQIMNKSGVILSIYNSAEYELIPYFNNDELKCGTLFVLLRFYMINLWNVTMLHNRGILKTNKLIKYYLNGYNRLRGAYEKKINIHDPKILAPTNKFYGYYIDRALQMKYYGFNVKKVPDYKPGEYKKKYGKLRLNKIT